MDKLPVVGNPASPPADLDMTDTELEDGIR